MKTLLAFTQFKKGTYHYTIPKGWKVLQVWIDGKILKKKFWRVFNDGKEIDLDYFGKGKKLSIQYQKR